MDLFWRAFNSTKKTSDWIAIKMKTYELWHFHPRPVINKVWWSWPWRFEESWNVARQMKSFMTFLAAQQLSCSLTHSTRGLIRVFQLGFILLYLLLFPHWTDMSWRSSLTLAQWLTWSVWRATGFVVCAMYTSLDIFTLGIYLGLVICAVGEAGSLFGMYLKTRKQELKIT